MIMTALLSNKNLFTKNIMDLIKLSPCLFQGGMKDSGSETCKIARLNGTYVMTRSTLFLEETQKT
jgi:hypothetical protein